MKKAFIFLLLLGLMGSCILPAAAEDAPPALHALLSPAAITDAAFWEDAGKTTWFVLTKDAASTHTLHCLTEENGHCTEVFRTADALPQGEGTLALHLTPDAWDFSQSPEGRHLPGPILLLLQYDEAAQAVELRMAFQRTDPETWRLISLKHYPSATNANLFENFITYYGPKEKAQTTPLGTVPCFIETDLRLFRLADFPKNVQEAQVLAP